jgi:hypothetical protein
MDKQFFDAHPPLIESPDDDIPDRSDYSVIGQLPITASDMNRVVDPQYPWRDYVGDGSPAYHKRVLQILAQRDTEVDHYVVTRRQYWQQIQRWHYGTDTQVTISKHSGYIEHHSHVTEQTHSVVDRVAADLGIDISPGGAAAPGEVPPVPPVAMSAAADGGNGGSGGQGGVNAGLHFSHEMTDMLHITDTDEQTFTEETTVTTAETFKGDTTYVYWQMREECILQRVPKATPADLDLVYSSLAATVWDYTDAYPPPTDDRNGGGGDIH